VCGQEEVKSYRFFTKEDALKEFRKLFQDEPVLVENTRRRLPTSYRVVPCKPELTKTIADEFDHVPGVKGINTPAKQVRALLNVRAGSDGVLPPGRRAARVVAVLDREHDRLATFARRREIDGMKLVGASNWFVRCRSWPKGSCRARSCGFAFASCTSSVAHHELLKNQHTLLQPF